MPEQNRDFNNNGKIIFNKQDLAHLYFGLMASLLICVCL